MRDNAYLSEKQINILKGKLLADKERILNKDHDPEHKERYYLDKNELLDPLDEAAANVQASQELRFRNRENFYLKKIGKALQRMEEGLYGLCDECGVEIAFERLSARPTAEMCITCKEESELSEKNNFFQKRSKSLGKTMAELN